MSPNRRIFLNIVATYGRSVFALFCGLFTARWVLMALGQDDYGLLGVVGGLVVFIGFVNSLLGGAVGGFYAVSVGAANAAADKSSALRECRAWFSTAVLVHTLVPLALMLAGEPIGEYADHSVKIVAVRDEAGLARAEWANLWRPGAPGRLRAKWAFLRANRRFFPGPLPLHVLRRALFAFARRHCYFRWIRRWRMRRLYHHVVRT